MGFRTDVGGGPECRVYCALSCDERIPGIVSDVASRQVHLPTYGT